MTEASPEVFREAMARLGAAVNVVTSDGPAGMIGITATAVCSLTDAPPQLIVCVSRRSAQNELFRQNGVLCVNTLSVDQIGLSETFSGRAGIAGEQRFRSAVWTRMETGSPSLVDAVASFDCRIAALHDYGSHTVFICRAVAIAVSEADGLAYFRRGYHPLRARLGRELLEVG